MREGMEIREEKKEKNYGREKLPDYKTEKTVTFNFNIRIQRGRSSNRVQSVLRKSELIEFKFKSTIFARLHFTPKGEIGGSNDVQPLRNFFN